MNDETISKFRKWKKELEVKKASEETYKSLSIEDKIKANKTYKKRIIKSYYDKYHKKLDKKVTEIIKKYNKYIIIDFHSYSDKMVEKLFNSKNNPDICIGVDSQYTDKELVNLTVCHFKKYGYSVEINKPYSGTIIPNKYLNKKEERLSSIMIEINKRIYLNNEEKIFKLKNCIEDYYNLLKLF